MSIPVASVLGFSQPRGLAISGGTCGHPRDAGPRVSIGNRVHPLMSLPPLQSASRSVVRPWCKHLGTSHGVSRPHRDLGAASPLTDEDPNFVYVPPAVFLTPSTAYSSLRFVGLFHPTATSGIPSSGAFPATQPTRFISASCLHVVGGVCLPPGEPSGASLRHLAFKALIRVAIRCCLTEGLTLPDLDPLLSFHSFGHISERLADTFVPAPFMALTSWPPRGPPS